MKSRTEVVNDSLERDRIVSMSDGFILSSKVLREEHLPDGTVRVRIIAQVVDEQTQAPDVGNRSQAVLSDRSADAASRADRQRNAAEMLGLVLEEARYPLGMFHATPTRPRMNEGTDFTELTWTTKLHANDAAWSRFVRDSGRALAALGAADSIVPWHARAAGRRLRDLTTAPPTIGRLADRPILLRLTPESDPFLPGPRENAVAPAEPSARDRTVLFMQSTTDSARTFTLSRGGFETLVAPLSYAAVRSPVLHTRFVDADGVEVLAISSRLALNLSTCVMLLAEMRDGVPTAIPAGTGVLADGRPMTEMRPMMLLPAIGIQGVLLREAELDFSISLRRESSDRIDRIECSLAWE